MSVMTDRQSVAANATSANVVAGKTHEFLPEPSIVTIDASADAVGLNMSVLIGGEILVDDQEMSASNRFPIEPDDRIAQGAGFGGDRLIVRYRNTTGAAIVGQTKVTIEPA